MYRYRLVYDGRRPQRFIAVYWRMLLLYAIAFGLDANLLFNSLTKDERRPTFYACDHVLYLQLKRWAKRCHPNKGDHWIANKYWHVVKCI